ncbi:alpha,alpha-phosphotrehalase [Lachnospiraceae bacterium ZAX-1]
MNFKDKVVYQIYPKSYLDTNGDGIGDFPGIIKKLPYLRELGVDMIWLNPFYPSPQRDNGYDVKDYCSVDEAFGSMEDLNRLIASAKALGIDLMLDMVFNHVSTEHIWFQKALAGDKKYQDYFIIRDEKTDWESKFGGSAWAPFGDTGKFYLRLFDVTQADLNWQNDDVKEELYNVLRFWMQKGVKGFRFDVINLIGKDSVLKDNKTEGGKPEYTDRPITHKYLKEMNKATFGGDPEMVTVGEMSSTTIENCILYTKPKRQELSMAFHFHHLKVDYVDGEKWQKADFDFAKLQAILHEWGVGMSQGGGWNALFWNNHDQPRALNRFIETDQYRVEGAKMLASAIHLNRGTPYIYMGEEIGMLDPDYESMDDYVDVESINAYQRMIRAGMQKEDAFELIKLKSRDNARIPMQWDDKKNAGFSSGTPWLKTGKSYQQINVKSELESGSIFRYYQTLIALRKQHKVIREGSYEPYAKKHEQVYAYIRKQGDTELLVLNNFFPKQVSMDIPPKFLNGEILISNYDKKTSNIKDFTLEPYQSLAILV